MFEIFGNLSLQENLFVFAICATGVWFAGARLTYIADALADRLKFAKSLMGLLVLSLATSLPEVATTLSAAVQQNRDLVLNNLFGGIALQTAILALADFWARGAITNYPRKANHALEAILLIVLLSITMVILVLGEPLANDFMGMGSVLIAGAYAGAIWLLRKYDDASDWVPVDIPEVGDEEIARPLAITEETATATLKIQAGIACLAILILGVALVNSAETIAIQSGLGAGFIGVTLLAAATSLPELTTSITAARMGAYTMAISNIFGSNLIMLVLVLPADLLYTSGPILKDAGTTVLLSIGFGMLVTAIFLVGLIVRRKPRVGALGLDSVFVMVIFLISIGAYYFAR